MRRQQPTRRSDGWIDRCRTKNDLKNPFIAVAIYCRLVLFLLRLPVLMHTHFSKTHHYGMVVVCTSTKTTGPDRLAFFTNSRRTHHRPPHHQIKSTQRKQKQTTTIHMTTTTTTTRSAREKSVPPRLSHDWFSHLAHSPQTTVHTIKYRDLPSALRRVCPPPPPPSAAPRHFSCHIIFITF